jgi:endonuclease/exonuclease/phosphatase family metal-dependent hydrolase
VVSLNIAGLYKTEAGQLEPEQIEELADVRDAFRALLAGQAAEADDRNEPVVFATQEAMGIDAEGRSCNYSNSPYGSVQEGIAATGESYRSHFQSWPCDETGHQGNQLLTNAAEAVGGYFQIPVANVCHNLGAQGVKVRFGPSGGDWMWVVNVHLEVEPFTAVLGFMEVVDWLKEVAGSDWDDLPFLIVGDFNVAADGYDAAVGGTGWSSTACGSPVTGAAHEVASAALEGEFADEGFVHVVDRELWTWRAWAPRRRIDYAVIRNAPDPGWTYGHLLHPTDGGGAYWTDHLGLSVTVRRPPADQIWLLTSR